MYIDLIIFLILIVLTLIFYKRKKVQGLIFLIVIYDIILRVLTFINSNIPVKSISNIVSKYISSGVLNMIYKYTEGTVELVLSWIFVGVLICFLYFAIAIFVKKKKI